MQSHSFPYDHIIQFYRLNTVFTPKHTVTLSELSNFCYDGKNVFLDAIVAGLSAPSLRKVDFHFRDPIWSPIVQLLRFINEIGEHYYAVQVYINNGSWMSFQNLEDDLGQRELRFNLGPWSLMRLSGALSTRLTTVKVLEVNFGLHNKAGYVWGITSRGAGSINISPASRRSRFLIPRHVRSIKIAESLTTLLPCPLWKKSSFIRAQ